MTPYKKPKLNQKRNLGLCWERAESDFGDGRVNPEKAFQEAWDHENSPHTGFGIGQEIFIVSKESANNFDGKNTDDIPYGGNVCVYKLSTREYRILATFVQWLGTNCGFGFLQGALQRCGYSIESRRIYPKEEKKRLDRYGILKAQQKKAEAIENQPEISLHPTRDEGIKKNFTPMQTELSLSPELCSRCPHSDQCKENKPGNEHCFKVLHHLV
jgi:hypothetical protein